MNGNRSSAEKLLNGLESKKGGQLTKRSAPGHDNNRRSMDNPLDMKYILENVQSEAKNLKLLLNLKEEQISMYEAKAVNLAGENEDLVLQLEDIRTKSIELEEENCQLKSILIG